MPELKKYIQRMVRGITDEDWRRIKIQGIEEGYTSTGRYIIAIHQEHMSRLNK